MHARLALPFLVASFSFASIAKPFAISPKDQNCSKDSDCILIIKDCHGQCDAVNSKYKTKAYDELKMHCLESAGDANPFACLQNNTPICNTGKCVIKKK